MTQTEHGLAPLAAAHDHLSDSVLADLTAARVAVPRERAADSFILHAPLELLARVALLPMVEPTGRDAARERIEHIARSFEAWGEPAAPPGRRPAIDDLPHALALLQGALDAGDLDDADRAAAWLATHLHADDLCRALADPILPLLSAAGHGSIFLYHLRRIAPHSRPMATMLRGLARELARYPGWELSWFRDLEPTPPTSASEAELAKRLRAPASPGDPGSNFIYPLMSLVDTSGLAADLLTDVVAVPPAEARRVLLRTAAMSMLQDDPGEAPYGWSHCLTMPQATLGLAQACSDPWKAGAVATTYVLGFRASLGKVALDPTWQPDRLTPLDLHDVLHAGPEHAAAAVWHAPADRRPASRTHLATIASAHHDAHLVKYTLACFDAVRTDPAAEALYLAAAAYLSAWWVSAEPS